MVGNKAQKNQNLLATQHRLHKNSIQGKQWIQCTENTILSKDSISCK